MRDRYLFIDRDGTLLREPPDEQVDSLEKMEFMPGIFRNLYLITHLLDYKLVMVSNQDGLGTPSYPLEAFEKVQAKLLRSLKNEDIHFASILIDDSTADNPSASRKPHTGLVTSYLQKDFHREASFVVGDRLSDLQLAGNMNIRGIRISDSTESVPAEYAGVCALDTSHWDQIFNFLRSQGRTAVMERNTNETRINGHLVLDGKGDANIETGLGFLNHMLDQLVKHGRFDAYLRVEGDLNVDEHHTVEDAGLALGKAFRQAMGIKKGLNRYGFHVPMDDSLASCVIDLGGRPYLSWEATFTREKVGDVPTELFEHFFRSFSDEARCNIHINARGNNEHHKIEAIFKAFARALRMAAGQSIEDLQLPTTKGRI
jgi:imidazoleglycerol-phosphate dehydratase/histidinol-phosphatase